MAPLPVDPSTRVVREGLAFAPVSGDRQWRSRRPQVGNVAGMRRPGAVLIDGEERSGPRLRDRAHWHLGAATSMHAINDALFAGVYPLLPLIAADLGLSYGEVGALKAVLGGASALLQVPAGILVEVTGEHLLLAAGTAWVGAGFLAMAMAASFPLLLAVAGLAGVGGNAQHPVANAAVARRFGGAARSNAVGTLNVGGDIGKVAAPFVAGAGAMIAGWRGGIAALGILGVAFAAAYVLVVPARWGKDRSPGPRGEPTVAGDQDLVIDVHHGTRSPWRAAFWGIARPGPFAALTAIGALDSAARGAALALMPFAFTRAGLDAGAVGIAFAVLFGAGAAGKFLCGPLAARAGLATAIVATEVVTAAGLVAIPLAPPEAILWAILPFGFSLNGTSSILYALVAPLAIPSRRARAYGLFYTTSLLALSVAPLAYGLAADAIGLTGAFVALGAATLAIVPIAVRWRGAFAHHEMTVTPRA